MLRFAGFLLLLSLQTPALRAQAAELADTLRRGQNERPDKPRFIFETDQRFFYFKDAGQPLLKNPINIWGARIGLLLPSNVKAGIGYYFTNQTIDEPWKGYQVSHRRLQYATAYLEPYFFRRKYWELSALFEAGLGTARYDLIDADTQESARHSTTAVPLSAGLSVSTKFPALFGFKPLRWFGINLMTGYRYTLNERVPVSPTTLNGVFYSISPAVFLDRIYQDIGDWRKSRKKAKSRR